MSGSTIIKNYKNMENNKFELYRKEVEALHEAALDDVESVIISIIDRDYGFHVVAQFLDAEYPARIDAYFRREWSSEKLHLELLYLQQFCEDFFENKEFPHRVVPF